MTNGNIRLSTPLALLSCDRYASGRPSLLTAISPQPDFASSATRYYGRRKARPPGLALVFQEVARSGFEPLISALRGQRPGPARRTGLGPPRRTHIIGRLIHSTRRI